MWLQGIQGPLSCRISTLHVTAIRIRCGIIKVPNSDQSTSPSYHEDLVTITRTALLLCINGSRPWVVPHSSLHNSTYKRSSDLDIARLRVSTQPHLLALLAAWCARQPVGQIRHLPPWVCLFGMIYDSAMVHILSIFPLLAKSAEPVSDSNVQWHYQWQYWYSAPVSVSLISHQYQTAAQLRLHLVLVCWTIQGHLFRLSSLSEEVWWQMLVQVANLHRDELTRGPMLPRGSFSDPGDEGLESAASLRELRGVATRKTIEWQNRTTTFHRERAAKPDSFDPRTTNTDTFAILATRGVPAKPWIEANTASINAGYGK